MRRTGLAIDLAVKPFNVEPQWSETTPPVSNPRHAESEPDDDNLWMTSGTLMTYEETKTRWERNAFKVVNSGNYVRCGTASAHCILEANVVRLVRTPELRRRPGEGEHRASGCHDTPVHCTMDP